MNSFCHFMNLHYVSKSGPKNERSMEDVQAKYLYTNLTIKTN